MVPDKVAAQETLGQRIGRLRALLGWTQQELADRVAISRVAVSHLEMGLSAPSERTVTLLAGVFHLEPLDLIEGTAYPAAKAERLPLVAARYTEVELHIALMQRDLGWLAKIGEATGTDVSDSVIQEWHARLAALREWTLDPGELRLLTEAQATLTAACGRVRHSARPRGRA